MVLLVNIALELIGFVAQLLFELLGGFAWGLLEAILFKSDVVAGFFVIGLIIAVILFCTMSPIHAAIWSVVEIILLIILGYVVDAKP